jgi:DNA-binding protein HU-beta
VNKTELIEHIAKATDSSKASAGRSLEAMIDAVRKTLKKGGTVSLVGFGTFAVGKRAARTGRNPRTGDTIKIKAAKVPKFRPGKGLKDAINGR